jgi:hypothetical protein
MLVEAARRDEDEVHVEGDGQPNGHAIARDGVAKPLGRVGVEPAAHRAADRPGVEQERDGQEQQEPREQRDHLEPPRKRLHDRLGEGVRDAGRHERHAADQQEQHR